MAFLKILQNDDKGLDTYLIDLRRVDEVHCSYPKANEESFGEKPVDPEFKLTVTYHGGTDKEFTVTQETTAFELYYSDGTKLTSTNSLVKLEEVLIDVMANEEDAPY